MSITAYPEQIQLFFIFVNLQNEFTHLIRDSYSLQSEYSNDDNIPQIPFSVLISKIKSFEKFHLDSSLMFFIDAAESSDFSNKDSTEISKVCFKIIPFLNDIYLTSSPSFLHPLYTLFFVLKEKPTKFSRPKLYFVSESSADASSSDIADITLSLPKTRKYGSKVFRKTLKN